MLLPLSDSDHSIEVKTTAIANDTMLRVWQGKDNAQADVRLSPSEARHLAGQLLHEAAKQDGKRVSFHWHAAACDGFCGLPERQRCVELPMGARS